MNNTTFLPLKEFAGINTSQFLRTVGMGWCTSKCAWALVWKTHVLWMLYGHWVCGAQLGLGGPCRHWQCVWGTWCHGKGDLHLGCLHSNVLVHTSPHCTCNVLCRDVLLIHISALCAVIFPWRQALRWGWKCKAGQKLKAAGATAWWERRVVYHFSTSTAGLAKTPVVPSVFSAPRAWIFWGIKSFERNFHESV